MALSGSYLMGVPSNGKRKPYAFYFFTNCWKFGVFLSTTKRKFFKKTGKFKVFGRSSMSVWLAVIVNGFKWSIFSTFSYFSPINHICNSVIPITASAEVIALFVAFLQYVDIRFNKSITFYYVNYIFDTRLSLTKIYWFT